MLLRYKKDIHFQKATVIPPHLVPLKQARRPFAQLSLHGMISENAFALLCILHGLLRNDGAGVTFWCLLGMDESSLVELNWRVSQRFKLQISKVPKAPGIINPSHLLPSLTNQTKTSAILTV